MTDFESFVYLVFALGFFVFVIYMVMRDQNRERDRHILERVIFHREGIDKAPKLPRRITKK